MALETIVYPQTQFTYNWNFNVQQQQNKNNDADDHNSSWEQQEVVSVFSKSMELITTEPSLMTTTTPGRRKRRRAKTCKNKEDVENQRMSHIIVERNRRKQMNEYLAVIRSLMPPSYVLRGDQASIIGGAINFVKELEHHLHTLEGHKKIKQNPSENDRTDSLAPFAKIFSFPQYSSSSGKSHDHMSSSEINHNEPPISNNNNNSDTLPTDIADIEVTLVESHVNVKILLKKRPKQLPKMVVGLQSLRLCILHLNVTTCDQLVLYSLSLKVEEGCKLSMVDEFAAAINQIVCKIEEENFLC